MKEVGVHQVFEKMPKPLSWLQRRKRVYPGVVHQCQGLKILKVLIKVAETTKGSSLFLTLSIVLFLYCFLLLIARHLGQCSSQGLGVFIFVALSCHTLHVAHDNFEVEIFLFYG